MKRILSFFGTITLIATSTTNLVACKPQYSEKELADFKKENNIKTKDGILEWKALQEQPFKQSDDKWYFVIWRGDKGHDWRIAKFKNDEIIPPKYEYRYKEIDKYDNNTEMLQLRYYSRNNTSVDLICFKFPFGNVNIWKNNDDIYFKAVYRWDGIDELKKPAIDPKTGKIINQKKDK